MTEIVENLKVIRNNLKALRSKTIFGNLKLFKNDEKCILFHLKSAFRSQDI